MRKRFLLEGEHIDKAIWIAVEFKEESVSVLLHLYLQSKVKKGAIQKWIRNEADLPKAFESIERTIEDQNLLTEEIKVVNLGKVRDIEIEWADNLLQTRMFQGFDGELLLLKDKIANLNDYSQDVFDECAGFWERLLNFKKDNSTIPNSKIDRYKFDLDILFEALKALRKDFKKEQGAKALEAKADLELKLDIVENKLKEKPNYKFTVDRLKEIRTSLNKSGLRQKHYADIDNRINAIFESMSAKKEKVNHAKYDKRINDLEGIVSKMQKSVDWDKRELAKETKNKDYCEQVFQLKLLDAKIGMIETRLKEKEDKLKNIHETLASLKKKVKD